MFFYCALLRKLGPYRNGSRLSASQAFPCNLSSRYEKYETNCRIGASEPRGLLRHETVHTYLFRLSSASLWSSQKTSYLLRIERHTYLLTAWCRVLLEKPIGLQLVKKFPAFHGTRRFFTALTNVRHLSLSWASPIQSIYPHPTSWRSFLILTTHLRLVLPISLFPFGFPTKTLYAPPLLTHARHMSSPSHELYR